MLKIFPKPYSTHRLFGLGIPCLFVNHFFDWTLKIEKLIFNGDLAPFT